MGVYNFQKRFIPFILDGRKTHTIRAIRKNPDKPGNTLSLYTGLRRKGAILLMRARCTMIQHILIKHDQIRIDGVYLADDEREALARRDGFSSFQEMITFWNGRLPFHGHIIHWRFQR